MASPPRRVLLAGAAGAIGRRLVPLLVGAGHEVVGTTRDPARAGLLADLGATPAIVDVYDRDRLVALVRDVAPDAVIHELTDLAASDFAANNRLRHEGTRNLVDAALAAGVRRIVAQSLGFAYAPGDAPAREDEPLDVDAPDGRGRMVAGVVALEDAAAELPEAVVLRYGTLYGPGTWYASDGRTADQVRRGELVADDSVTSFLHVDDAAGAALEALDWPAGPVNICDDQPAPGRTWLGTYAARLGAPKPPYRPGREQGMRGADNSLARRFGWRPIHPSWREGFETGLG